MKKTHTKLRITEIFHSLQGESLTVGLPTVFVRLTGCPLRCQYCDTAYAFSGGDWMEIAAILEKIASYRCKQICISGGEPLAQPNCIPLLRQLCDAGYTVSIETSGALPITDIDTRVTIIMDIKTPDSKESDKNLLENIPELKRSDQIKFVLCSEKDYHWACTFIATHKLREKTHILFSPSWHELKPADLANWIIRDRLPVRFQLQLHKILWDDKPGH